jgi:hypothetical protein
MSNDKTEPRKTGTSKSGVFPRPNLSEPNARREAPPPPTTPPEYFDGGATTGSMTVVTERSDASAERDNDHATRGT